MSEKYLKVIESLGEIIITKELDISLLKYENEKLKAQIEEMTKQK